MQKKFHIDKFILMVCVIFLLAGVIYSFAWKDAPYEFTDSHAYFEIAQDLTNFRLDQFHVRAPGYPWLMLVTGAVTSPTRLLFYTQMILYFTAVLLLILQLRRIGVAQWMLWLFVGVCLLPYNIFTTAMIMTEAFSQFLISFAIFGLVVWLSKKKIWGLIISALCFAYEGITKPSFWVFSVVLAIALLFLLPALKKLSKRLLIAFASILLAAMLIVGSLCIINLTDHDYFGVTPLLGFNLTQKTARVLEDLPDEYAPMKSVLIKYRDQSLLSYADNHSAYNYIWEIPINELKIDPTWSHAQLSSYLTKMNLYLIVKNPFNYVQEVGYSLTNYFMPAASSRSFFGQKSLQAAWAVFYYITLTAFLVSTIYFIARLFRYFARRKLARRESLAGLPESQLQKLIFLLLGYFILLYNLLITILVEIGEPRTRLSVELVMLAIAAIGVDEMLKERKQIRASDSIPG